jgi:hypothetical protein
MRPRNRSPRRHGVAAIELAVVTILFLVPLIIGVWETGRIIHVKQVVSNAAREGARLAGQAYVIRSDGNHIQIKRDSGSPSVREVVVGYLRASGLNVTADDVTINFQFITPRTTPYYPIPGLDPPGTNYGAGSLPPEPCYGEKGQVFTLTVSVPWNKVRWINLGVLRPNRIEFTVTWQMLTDDSFQVNTTLPTW